MYDPRSSAGAKWFKPTLVLALLAIVAATGYALWTWHENHLSALVAYLPALALLACPLMHLFMHRGHGGHGGGDRR